MRKTIILTSILFISCILIAVLYFSQLSEETHNNYKILGGIPLETALIFQFKNDNTVTEIFKNYELFDVIFGEQRTAELNQIQQLILKHPQLQEALDNENIYLSLFPNSADSIDLLWTLTINKNLPADDISEILLQPSNDISTKKIIVSNREILSINIKSLNKVFYVFIENGVAAGSFSKDLIQKFLSNTTPKISKEFIAEISSSGPKNENSPFNIFINHSSAFQFSANFLRNRPDGNFSLLKDLKSFSILNMNFKSDAFMFNGISKADTSSANYLNLFLHQKPVINSIKKIFPANTANFIAFGISDYKKFHQNLNQLLQKRKELDKLNDHVKHLEQKYGINLERDLTELWANEFAVLALSSNEKLSVIQLNNGRQMEFLLEPLSSAFSKTVRRFNDSNLLYYYFGDPLKSYSRPYFTIIDNYLVVANDAGTVQRFADSYTNETLLYKTAGFIEFNQFIANQSSVMFFIHTKNSNTLLRNILKKSYADILTEENSRYKNFYGLAYQWSAEKDHFLINLYTNYTSTDANKLELVWKYHLKGRLAIPPQIISGIGDKKLVFVQDNVNNIYVLSADGEKQWSTQLPDKIISRVYQLKDGTLLFNTSQKLYRISTSGISYEGFPVSLSQKASYGLIITDNDAAQLKIFIPCTDRIVAFDVSGTSVNGWEIPDNGKILFDLKTARLNDTNYLIAGTENGSVYFFNFNGNLISKIENITKANFRNPLSLEINTDIKDSRIISTDTTGVIKSIFFNGNVIEKNIGVWSGEHFFNFYNITGDINPELIYLDKNQLYIYSSDNTLVYNYDFGSTITSRPQFFPVNQSTYRIGVSAAKDNLLYLFNDDGNLEKGFPVTGVPYFYAGSIINNGMQHLICGDANNYLYVYKL